MGAYLTLVRRELGSYFFSLTAYVVIAAVLLLVGVSFLVVLEAYNGDLVSTPLTELWQSSMFFWLIVLLASPLITMRLFALEKFSGTFETLMTVPVSDLQVVLAKFTGGFLFYLTAWIPLLACIYVVHQYTDQGTVMDWWPVASTYLGVALIGSLYIAMGTFASALTRSQIIAAMVSLAFGVGLFLISFLKFSLGTQTSLAAKVVSYVGMIEHMEDFASGVVDTRYVTFYLTLTALFLFLTLKVVESRRWK
jgi:ABC-2 type transport system permease protein